MSRDEMIRALSVAAAGGDPLAVEALALEEARTYGARIEDPIALVTCALELLARATARFEDIPSEMRDDLARRSDHWGAMAYRASVSAIARDCIGDLFGERMTLDTARETLEEHIRESCDGSRWVIYTSANHDVLKHSDNDEAWQDFGYEDGAPLNVRAYCALERDVTEAADEMWGECEACEGYGEIDGPETEALDSDLIPCPDCNGNGWAITPEDADA